MAFIRVIDESDADGELAELYRELVDPESHRVDEVLKVHSLNPRGLAAHATLYRAAMRSTKMLPKVEREMIATVVSRINGCGY